MARHRSSRGSIQTPVCYCEGALCKNNTRVHVYVRVGIASCVALQHYSMRWKPVGCRSCCSTLAVEGRPLCRGSLLVCVRWPSWF